MFPVQTKITRKGSGDVTDTFCPPPALLPSAESQVALSAHRERASISPRVAGFGPREEGPIAEAEGMYSLALTPGVGSGTFWTWMLVSREIGAAISVLEEAGAALVPLVDETDWQSSGLRALHGLLGGLRDGTGAEIGQLRVREWELGAGGGA